MKNITILLLLIGSTHAFAIRSMPTRYVELLKFVQGAPDQGETNTCLYMASTGAMELLMNQKEKIRNPKAGAKYDLAESFIINQRDYWDKETRTGHFIEEIVIRFNHGEAVHISLWPYNAFNEDGTDNMGVWNRHADYVTLPRMSVPKVKTELLFARGKKWDTYVLTEKDILTVKETLVKRKSPVIINYNDDGYWHVVLIVGYDDKKKGECYELEESECGQKGSFYVRDSNGKRYEARDYNWFLYKANAAAVVELR